MTEILEMPRDYQTLAKEKIAEELKNFSVPEKPKKKPKDRRKSRVHRRKRK